MDPEKTQPDTLRAIFRECQDTRQVCERVERRVLAELGTLRRRVDHQLYLTLFAVALSVAALATALRG